MKIQRNPGHEPIYNLYSTSGRRIEQMEEAEHGRRIEVFKITMFFDVNLVQ